MFKYLAAQTLLFRNTENKVLYSKQMIILDVHKRIVLYVTFPYICFVFKMS